MADLREDFVNYVVKNLVSNPEGVQLKRSEDDKGEFLELTVDPADMGKVIGKAGATAKSIRTLLRGVGAKDNLEPLPLKIVDPEGHTRPEAPVAEADESSQQTAATAEPVAAIPEPEPAPAEEQPRDEHAERMERTKREAQELADFEL